MDPISPSRSFYHTITSTATSAFSLLPIFPGSAPVSQLSLVLLSHTVVHGVGLVEIYYDYDYGYGYDYYYYQPTSTKPQA